MKSFKIAAILFLSPILTGTILAQESVKTFEMRYFTNNPKADGVTDFHGETELFDTDQRIDLLNEYARFSSRFWGDPDLDRPLFSDKDVKERLARIKPQPLSSVRRTVPLKEWKAYGYKRGKEDAKAAGWKGWLAEGAVIKDGRLVLDGKSASPSIEPITWRFRLKVSLSEVPEGLHVVLDREGADPVDIEVGPLEYFEIYGDLPNRRIFLSSSEKTLKVLSLKDDRAITSFSVGAPAGRASVEHLSLYAFDRHEEMPTRPYWSRLVFDEDFEAVPSMEGWYSNEYDDSLWGKVFLPSPLGGEKAAGESYYLRTKVHVRDYEYASLELEALDPAGEVWINGEPVAVLKGRIPWKLDVGEYLRKGEENTIAVRVKPYFGHRAMFHSPSDHNFGWYLGRTSLVLTDTRNHITETLVHTRSLESGKAVQHHKITIRNESHDFKKGSLTVNYYPWFPEDGPLAASVSREVDLRPMNDNVFEFDSPVDDPSLWSPYEPRLYKVEVILKDEEGKAVDDFVTTTGIRLIEQKEGVLYVNHRPEMLNGAQIFGFHLPVENIPVTIRCATDEMVMSDLMMAKDLGNLLRIHVHSESDVAEGLNDARLAEYADQLGLFLIWQTSAWIREGEVWNIDMVNYPLYMRQVYNHPSIAMWEGGNHPSRFKAHDFNDTEDSFTTLIKAIATTDSSRLISPISFWQNSHYANYDGTIDSKGKKHAPNPWLMHRMMTRGSQDSYSGYNNNWSELRKIPRPFAKLCLEAKDLCYFNFEHEESIGQPNWELAVKEPWYEVFSYEHEYEAASIGRLLDTGEWRASQAYQAFSAWESMKIQTLLGVSGFSWCSLESGPNMFTYQKPLVDPFRVPKLAYHANKMIFNRIWAGSDDVDVAYGPGDEIRPVIFNLDGACKVNLTVELLNGNGKVLERKIFKNIEVAEGRSVTRLAPFRFRNKSQGNKFIVYSIRHV